MKLFTCRIAVGGSRNNEVLKHNVTPAEVTILRVLHGADSVHGIEQTGTVNRSDRRERERLAGIYSHTSPSEALSGEQLVLKYFGPATPLPVEIEDPMQPLSDDDYVEPEDEEEIVPLETVSVPVATRTTRVPRPARDAVASMTA